MVCKEKLNSAECKENSFVIEGFKSSKECLLAGANQFSKEGFECGKNCRIDSYGLKICKEICNSAGCGENAHGTPLEEVGAIPTAPQKTEQKNNAIPVLVTKYSSPNSEGFNLSIANGNESTCVWNYEGGTGRIPYSETTKAQSGSFHVLAFEPLGMDFLYGFGVTCVDDFGNTYTGFGEDLK